MKDQMTEWIMDPKTARKWAKGWLEDAKSGCHYPVKAIRQAAEAYKERYCTDGLWMPAAKKVYDILRDAQDKAQQNYEDAQPGMED